MLKLYLVIYNAVGLISGVVGPVPVPENCTTYVQDATAKMLARPDLEQLTFKCEWHDQRPNLQEH